MPFVCVSVFSHDISKTDAARITKLDREMFRDVAWKPIYFGVRMLTCQGHESQKHCRRRSLHSCECWLLIICHMQFIKADLSQ